MSGDTFKVALGDATNAQLRYYAEGVLNIDGIKPVGQSNAFLISKIKGVLGEEVEQIELPSTMKLLGATSAPALDVAPAGEGGLPAGPESRHFRYDPKVEIEIQNSNDKTRSRDCYINCNGDVLQVQRGKRVKIPYRHYLVLVDAVEKVARDTDEINPITHMPVKEWVEQPSYPFSVFSLPSEEEIAAWHKRMDNVELRAGPEPARAAA
ncbi:hypothetical protein [Sphingopyxis flava]|uniref:Uncharacterized protein n=1 Tax=Sphingopyxis flava TaxID=1507287 RepID=A0A1T5ABN7_9SPHN|nr:hypothetical protein [Sphingopyxis flava]SKB32384.1 hypothetical protein SAMN06295937_100374 [Sphingopyxis flava]